jgi:pyridoxine 4-oxidase
MYLNSSDFTAREGSPDIVLACVIAPSASEAFTTPEYGTAFTLLFGVTHPASRGHLRPSGPSSEDQPVIDPQYLSTAHDRDTFRKAFRAARQVGHHPALDEWRLEEAIPGPEVESDAQIDDYIARAVSTHHHPCGTCRMGRDQSSVVDENLRLRGLDNVFVVDASIIPKIPCGPINASVLAIAETWAAANA